jgi:hypothetical protein
MAEADGNTVRTSSGDDAEVTESLQSWIYEIQSFFEQTRRELNQLVDEICAGQAPERSFSQPQLPAAATTPPPANVNADATNDRLEMLKRQLDQRLHGP